jgi:ribosomal RNA-processing protein 12
MLHCNALEKKQATRQAKKKPPATPSLRAPSPRTPCAAHAPTTHFLPPNPAPRCRMDAGLTLREQLASQEHLLHVLDGIKEVILDMRPASSAPDPPEPSSTEYFAALTTALDASEQSHSVELLCLLRIVSSQTNHQTIRAHFARVSSSLLRIAQQVEAEGEEGSDGTTKASQVQEGVLRCYGALLAAHSGSAQSWSSPALLRAFSVLLSAAGGNQPRLRRASQAALIEVLAGSGGGRTSAKSKGKGPHDLVVDFLVQALSASAVGKSDSPNAMSMLHFASSVAPSLGARSLGKLSDAVLKLTSLENPTVTAASMRCLSSIVQSQPQVLQLQVASSQSLGNLAVSPVQAQPESVVKLMTAALGLAPQASDAAGACAFAQFLANCLVRLSQLSPSLARGMLLPAISVLVSYCEGAIAKVHSTACQAMNTSFQVVVDQTMVSDMVSTSAGRSLGQPGSSSALANVLQELQNLLRHKYQRAWPASLPLLGRLFLHLRAASYPVLIGTLKGLGELHDALTSTPSAAPAGVLPALDEAIGFAIEGVGMERLLAVLPLRPAGTPDTVGVAESRSWLLPLLRAHGKSADSRLGFFHQELLALARHCDSLSRSDNCTANERRTHSFRVVQLWQILPCFCSRPTDVGTALGALAPLLANAMKDSNYPEILPEVCQALQTLVEGLPHRDANGSASSVVTDASTRFLPLLYSIAEQSATANRADARVVTVCRTASVLTSVAPPSFLATTFKKLLQKLLVNTVGRGDDISSEHKERLACIYLDLLAGMVPFLSDECVQLCYRATKPLIRDEVSSAVQKRSYKVLLQLCRYRKDFIISGDRLPEVLDLLVGSLLTCHVTVCRCRLQCLILLAEALDVSKEAHVSAIKSIAGEVVLCTKSSNGRTREAAHALLITLGRGDPVMFMTWVAAAMAGKTAHMRSAGLLSLAVLQKKFGHFRSPECQESVQQITPDLILTALVMLREPHGEVTHAVLGYLRVAIGGLDRNLLEPVLPSIVGSVMVQQHEGAKVKTKYRSLVKVILKKLCRKFGFDRIGQLVPEADKRLVRALQKISERELRQKQARQKGGGHSGEGRGAQGRMVNVMVREHVGGGGVDGDVVDLLDGSMVQNLRVADSDSDSDSSNGPEMEVDDDGKLIMPGELRIWQW